jgi:thiosulfate/3-mercaptopyruvate sulfurtransferase
MKRPAFCLLIAAVASLAIATEIQGSARPDLLVTTDWLGSHLARHDQIVLHVGSSSRIYDTGHIPGALYVDLSSFVVDRNGIPNELPPVETLQKTFQALGIGNHAHLVLYGDNPLYATRLFFTLDYLGHGMRASLLDGGLEKWKGEERPVTTGVPRVSPATFTPYPQPDVLVRLPELKTILRYSGSDVANAVSLIDARPAAQFSGVEAGTGISRPGHIPQSVNICWKENLITVDGYQLLRPAEQLRELYTASGTISSCVTIAYCRTGMEATMTYFVLKYLGHDVALYDGSYYEWSGTGETSIEKSS